MSNIDIESYSKLIAFLRQQAVGFKSKKSKVPTSDDVEKYLNEAPDQIHLATKDALIFGITGACRREELSKMTVNDIQDLESSVFVAKLAVIKAHIKRTFTATNKFYTTIKNYQVLRPPNCKCDATWFELRKWKMYSAAIGIHK